MRRPSPAAALACLALAPTGLLAIDPTPSSAAPGDSRAAQLTRVLQRDPVYVSPSLSRVVTPAEVEQLRREVAAMPFPTYVAVVPRFYEEPGSRLSGDLSTVLRDRIGRDGLYVVSDGGSAIEARAFGVRTRGEIRRVGSIVLNAVPRREGPIARVRFALDHLRTGRTAERSLRDERERNDRLPWLAMAGGGVLGLLVPLAIAAVLPSGRRARAADRAFRARRRAGAPSHDPTISEPLLAETTSRARDAVGRLGRAIESASAPPDEALRAYSAASRVLEWDDPQPVDLVGATVLARRGRRALKGPVPPPCFFDPRHGDGLRSSRWRRGKDDVAIPVCKTCAGALSRNATPVSLGDRGRPYWDRDTVWAQTGFGAIDDRVADVVLAGRAPR